MDNGTCLNTRNSKQFSQFGLWKNLNLRFWRDPRGPPHLHRLFAATCTIQTWEKLGHNASLSSGKSSFVVGVDEEGFLIIVQTYVWLKRLGRKNWGWWPTHLMSILWAILMSILMSILMLLKYEHLISYIISFSYFTRQNMYDHSVPYCGNAFWSWLT